MRLTKVLGVILALIACSAAGLLVGARSSTASGKSKSTPRARIVARQATVLPDRRVTFTLSAPQAGQVMLNFQNKVGPSPAADAIPMTKDANGVWSVTIGPLEPNLYGYGFIVDGAKVADPANRDTWLGATSSWSNVFVPGPAADFIADASVPHGAWATVRYYSNLTHTERQMQVYTPPGYNADHRRYPVLYLMHGGGGNDTDWIVNMRANYIMDNLFAKHAAKRMIVVMPDGNVTSSFNINYSVPQDVFPEELLGSIVPTIERNYRAAPGASNRALAGLSLGGLWTFDTLLLHPGEFAYYGDFSSGWFQATRDDLVQNHSDLLTNRQVNKRTKLLWITVGGPEDIAYNNNIATRALFDQYHVKYKFVQGTGGHVWDTWRRNLRDFAPLLFR
jgi:enterochelin esterase family protein